MKYVHDVYYEKNVLFTYKSIVFGFFDLHFDDITD